MTSDELRRLADAEQRVLDRTYEVSDLYASNALRGFGPDAARLLAGMADVLARQVDEDTSDFFTITFDWHREHMGEGEEVAEDCVVCQMDGLLSAFASLGETP